MMAPPPARPLAWQLHPGTSGGACMGCLHDLVMITYGAPCQFVTYDAGASLRCNQRLKLLTVGACGRSYTATGETPQMRGFQHRICQATSIVDGRE